jgi:ribonuclease HI
MPNGFLTVSVEKKRSDKIRVCIDFRNLNRASPKDEYPMPIAGMLISDASGHKVLSFLDGNAGYNQIFMAKEDMYKTAFRCPGFVGLFSWVVMTFGLKNAGCQRAMNLIFHELLGIIVEVYIDDIVVKLASLDSHLTDLHLAFEKMCQYGLKMNPLKCPFGVSASKFLGFIIHEHGIEIDPKRVKSINKVKAPTCKKELQSFLGKVNYLRWFISNLSGRVKALTPILQLKNDAEFIWRVEQQATFEEIKGYLSTPPVLKAPKSRVPFSFYVAPENDIIIAVLIQETKGNEHIITYVSRRLLDVKTRYQFIEKLCFLLYYACTKLRHYLISSTCIVACQTDVIKHMLHRPFLSGGLGKWVYCLVEYDLIYESLKSIKAQIVADFIVEHRVDIEHDLDVGLILLTPWKLYFDGSACSDGQDIGTVFISPNGAYFEMASKLEYFCTNNQAKYEALLFSLEILESMDVKHVEDFDDSLLVVRQVSRKYQCLYGSLNTYLDKCLDIIARFDKFSIHHIYRHENSKANGLAQQAPDYNVSNKNFNITRKAMCMHVQNLSPSVLGAETGLTDVPDIQTSLTNTPIDLTGPTNPNNPVLENSASSNLEQDKAYAIDWWRPIIDYLWDPSHKVDRKVRRLAFKFTLVEGELYHLITDDLLLKCLDSDQAKVAVGEVHEGICGTHQSAPKMKWLLQRGGFYWPTMIADCFRYHKGCEEC